VFLKKHYVALVFSDINSLENTFVKSSLVFFCSRLCWERQHHCWVLSVTASLVTQTQHIGKCLTLTSTHYKELLKSVRNVMNTINVAVEGPSTNNMCVPAIVIQTAPLLYLFGPFFSSLWNCFLKKKKLWSSFSRLFRVGFPLFHACWFGCAYVVTYEIFITLLFGSSLKSFQVDINCK
jgi:hypothetical protein